MNGAGSISLVVALAAFCCSAGGQPAQGPGILGTAPRGVGRTLELVWTECDLRARAVNPRTTTLVVSVEAAEIPGRWTVHYVGIAPGMHDVTQFVECVDGRQVDLEPMLVQIISTLSPGLHATLATELGPIPEVR